MFLKNDSKFQIGLRTRVNILTIRPNECVHILDKDIIDLNKNLRRISETEYNNWVNKSTQLVNNSVEPEISVASQVNNPEENSNEHDNEKEEITENSNGESADLTELEILEKELNQLKTAWEQAKRPNKKAALQNQIKEIQEKINKLK